MGGHPGRPLGGTEASVDMSHLDMDRTYWSGGTHTGDSQSKAAGPWVMGGHCVAQHTRPLPALASKELSKGRFPPHQKPVRTQTQARDCVSGVDLPAQGPPLPSTYQTWNTFPSPSPAPGPKTRPPDPTT